MATWRSGYAAACKAVYAGSIPAVASGALAERSGFLGARPGRRWIAGGKGLALGLVYVLIVGRLDRLVGRRPLRRFVLPLGHARRLVPCGSLLGVLRASPR